MDRLRSTMEQSYKGEKARSEEAPSPALSHLSVKSDQSMDRPIAFNNETPSYISHRPDEAPSPATSYFSLKSNQSMDRPISFKDRTQPYSVKRLRPDETPSPAPSLLSVKSDQSMDRPITFNSGTPFYIGFENHRPDEAPSPATSYFSLKSNQSMDRPISFKDRTQPYSVKRLRPNETPSPAPSLLSVKSDQSMDRPITSIRGTPSYTGPDESPSPEPSVLSVKSEQSMDRPIAFRDETQSYSLRSTLSATLLTEDHCKCPVCTEVFKDPVSIPCGHSYCKHCIEIYWSNPTQAGAYACPQCRKRFRDHPVLNVNVALSKLIEEVQKAEFSPALPAHCYAGHEDVPCDICTEMKLKAVKTCLTCTASYCETHIRQHYTVPALQRHNLGEAIQLSHKEDRESQEESKAFKARLTELEATLKEREILAKRLCKGFEIHCIDFSSDVIEMAALGHSLNLGMLYNSHSDSFCQDIILEEDTVASIKVSLPRPQTCVKILECDSIQERFRELGISLTMLQNGKAALTKLSGAAAFLNHPEQSQHQDRITLHYRTTTRLDMISQRLLKELAPSSVINATTATHVIIGMCYGAQAFFVFDYANDKISTERHAEMENVIKKITTTPNARDALSSLTEKEKTNSSDYYCSLYTDVGDWKSPVSFHKAVEIYGSLPMLLGSKGERAVPLKVWLYPLKNLNKISVCAALSGVGENLIHQAENILEHLRKQIRICQDMITDYINIKVIVWFPALKYKLVQFSDLLQEYKNNFHRSIAEIVESIHMKQVEKEKSLQVLLETHDQSPFSVEKPNQWLENKKTELKILNDLRAADITVVKSQAELQQVIGHSHKTRVMCFTLFSPDSEDLFLSALRQYIKSDHMKSLDSLLLKPVSINQNVLIDVQLFIAAKETNEDVEQTKFITTFIPGDGFPEYSVKLCSSGIGSRNVKLSIKPDLAQIVQMKHTSVSLKLIQRQTKSIGKYMVEYRALGDDGMSNKTWKLIVFDATTHKKTCMISGLKSGHKYQLRYSVIEQDCTSNFSNIMKFQTAVAATPGQPLINKLDRDTLRVTWSKAENDEDCPVLRYMVEYKEAGLEGWSSVQTQGPECEYSLTVPHSTCYKVRVSAVYEDITSKPSEETPVPVDVWSIDLSERKSSILLEVLKLQTEKKPVELIDWTDEESEVKGFLQCLPYISQLRFVEAQSESPELSNKRKRFILNLHLQAALHHKETVQLSVKILLSSVNYEKSDFLLDLCSHVKNYETRQAGVSFQHYSQFISQLLQSGA